MAQANTPFDYMSAMNEAEKKYTGRMNRWLFDTFMNTSAAPRNDRPWFEQCIAKTLDARYGGNPIVIGLTGLAGSGKDSAIAYLDGKTNSVQIRTCRLALADPLKEIAAICGFTREQLTQRDLKEKVDEFWGISPRQFLQMCGTEMFRKVWRDDIWVKLVEKRITELRDTEYETEIRFGGPSKKAKMHLIFVTDVRFPNEAQKIKDLGGCVIRIERPNNPNKIAAKHDSEKFIEELPVDLTITNDCASADEWGWKFAKDLTMFFDNRAFYA